MANLVDMPDVYFDKTKAREIKLTFYQNELGRCVNVRDALDKLMSSFVAPPALNLRPDGNGNWLNVNNGETLTAREINRRFLLFVLEQMKEPEHDNRSSPR